MFARPANPVAAVAPEPAPTSPPGKLPRPWSLSNWPVRWKVAVLALAPLLVATAFGAARIADALADFHGLELAEARAEMAPAIANYMSAVDVGMSTGATGASAQGVRENLAARTSELRARLADTDVTPDLRSGVARLLDDGQALADAAPDDSAAVPNRIAAYVPLLLGAQEAIDASAPIGDERLRSQVRALSRAVGTRGQMTVQRLLATGGTDLPGDTELLDSIATARAAAEQNVRNAVAEISGSVAAQADARRRAAIREGVLVLAVLAAALGIALLVARALVKPLRLLRDGAVSVARTGLDGDVDRVRGGAEPHPEPLAIRTTDEIGQVAGAVDELHTRALLLARDEARLRALVTDMFETTSRRSRSLVDQQLVIIGELERGEEDPERLDGLLRLDHLAARLRRNSANLLVLAGAQITRDQREPVPLATVINAALSEVQDYRRVEVTEVPEAAVLGSASGAVIHLLAELTDNAVRYSPPATAVTVSAVRGSEGGVLLRIVDAGIGMTEADRRTANMRLQADHRDAPGPTPQNARHMGLFVAGRLAARHGLQAELRRPAGDESGSGTTAQVYLPRAVLEGEHGEPAEPPARRYLRVTPPRAEPDPAAPTVSLPGEQSGTAVTALPGRGPGGATGAAPRREVPPKQERPLPTPWWQKAPQRQTELPTRPGTAPPPGHESPQEAGPAAGTSAPPAPPAPSAPSRSDRTPAGPVDDDAIYQRMLTEMTGDPHDLLASPDLDWRSVWDRGWTMAADAEDAPVDNRTEAGLAVRTPGARLVPGSPEANRGDTAHEPESTDDGPDSARQAEDVAPARDPEAVRTSLGSHFTGVRAGRAAGETSRDTDRS
ncbi:ATP-binding protein [Mycobacterium sp.]|uniref:sensor histidine kinase n=1 Tax=Mycobacterium sp. TaxID=1785 RepID=UPI003A86325D